MTSPNLRARIWASSLLLALPAALLETTLIALFFQDLGLVDRFRFLTFYAAALFALTSAIIGLCSMACCWLLGKDRAVAVRIGSGLAAGVFVVLGLRLLLALRVGQIIAVSFVSLAGATLVLGASLLAFALGYYGTQWHGRWRGDVAIVAICGATFLALALFATRFVGYEAPSAASEQPSAMPRPLAGKGETNLLLISIDTLRADHLRSYGYARETAPVLSRLASEGVLLEGITQRTQTAGSMATLFTGKYPPTHGVLDNRQALDPENLTLAEVLRARGYWTFGATANPSIGRTFNFDQGFSRFIGREVGAGAPSSDRLNQHILGILDEMPNRPFFAWIHYVDPHQPYLVPEHYRHLFTGDDLSQAHGNHPSPTELAFGEDAHKSAAYNSKQLDFAISQYDAEIRFNDDSIGELLERLKRNGHLDNTLIVVTSDHGESLGGARFLL